MEERGRDGEDGGIDGERGSNEGKKEAKKKQEKKGGVKDEEWNRREAESKIRDDHERNERQKDRGIQEIN